MISIDITIYLKDSETFTDLEKYIQDEIGEKFTWINKVKSSKNFRQFKKCKDTAFIGRVNGYTGKVVSITVDEFYKDLQKEWNDEIEEEKEMTEDEEDDEIIEGEENMDKSDEENYDLEEKMNEKNVI
jgi:hypothetical protein